MESSSPGNESEPDRRAHERRSAESWVVEIANRFSLVRGRVIDRSPRGLGVRSSRPLRVGHSVSILLDVSGAPDRLSNRGKISLQGKVRWSRKQDPDEEYRSGIEVQLPADLTGS